MERDRRSCMSDQQVRQGFRSKLDIIRARRELCFLRPPKGLFPGALFCAFKVNLPLIHSWRWKLTQLRQPLIFHSLEEEEEEEERGGLLKSQT
ncbi:Uncharacterized protein TCM_004462 [Theobroma cacao]|uniref:Uncharacterized protein n=1 Tax=Theobroma cacao TaxID=3641 RepID=A0A061DQ60_THECC|nr:Uncharacterized protein TCM_004462 [Theobroma cacao]